MNTRSINRKVIELLTELSDNKEVRVTQNKHIKISGMFGGVKHSLTLACSPGSHYQRSACASLRKFIRFSNLPLNPTDFTLG